jgi:DNA-binding response OmpR family regulator
MKNSLLKSIFIKEDGFNFTAIIYAYSMKNQKKSVLKNKNIEAKKKTILIVEDEEPIRITLRDRLLDENFSVIEAGDGEEGLKAALTVHPDLILLDIIMPVMDGMTMLQKLRQDPWGEKAKVIILTNLNDTTNMVESIEYNTYEYLVKSDWKLDDVAKEIRKHLAI